jgi:hypothetical protein
MNLKSEISLTKRSNGTAPSSASNGSGVQMPATGDSTYADVIPTDAHSAETHPTGRPRANWLRVFTRHAPTRLLGSHRSRQARIRNARDCDLKARHAPGIGMLQEESYRALLSGG